MIINVDPLSNGQRANYCEILLREKIFPIHYAYEYFPHLYLEHALSPCSLYSQFSRQQSYILGNNYYQLRTYIHPTIIEIGCANGYKTWKVMRARYNSLKEQQRLYNTSSRKDIFETISNVYTKDNKNTRIKIRGRNTKFIKNYFGLDFSGGMIELAGSKIFDLKFIPSKYIGNQNVFGRHFSKEIQSIGGAKTYLLLGLTLANISKRREFLDYLCKQMNSGDTLLLDLPTHPDIYDDTYRQFTNSAYKTKQAEEFELQTMESLGFNRSTIVRHVMPIDNGLGQCIELELQNAQTVNVNNYTLKFPEETVFSVVKSERFSHAQAELELLGNRPQWHIAEQIIIHSSDTLDKKNIPLELMTCYILQKL